MTGMQKSGSKRYTVVERDELVQLYRQSGYSAWRFCKEMKLGYMTLKRWLEEEAPKVSLVEVSAVDQPAGESSISLRVRLPNGLVCELGGSLDMPEVLKWVRELKRC